MKTDSLYTSGLYVPSEMSLLIRPKDDVRPAAERKAIVVLHGHGGGGVQFVPGTFVGDHAQVLADVGYWVFSIDAGGGATWNNDAAMTAITAAYNWLVAQGMSSAKIGLLAWSMGGGNALQWIKSNAALVAGAFLFAPASNLGYFYGGGNAEIDTAYGGNYAVNSVGHKISDELATWQNKCPIKLVHGTSDVTVPLAQSQAFIAGVNQAQVTLDTLSGSDHTTVLLNYPYDSTRAFFDGLVW